MVYPRRVPLVTLQTWLGWGWSDLGAAAVRRPLLSFNAYVYIFWVPQKHLCQIQDRLQSRACASSLHYCLCQAGMLFHIAGVSCMNMVLVVMAATLSEGEDLSKRVLMA